MSNLKNISTSAVAKTVPSPVIFVGIDWADAEHEFVLTGPDGEIHRGAFKQDSTAITRFLEQWSEKLKTNDFYIGIETNNGALVNALLEHGQVTIYPINPAALASYRKAFAHGGGKNDQVDAALIHQYLTNHRAHLKPLLRDTPATRRLAVLTRDRREIVEQRVDMSLQLKSLLKTYFPAVLAMKASKPYAEFLLRLVSKYPCLAEVKKAGRAKIRKLFYGLGTKQRIQQRLDALFDAEPLTTDEITITAAALKAQLFAQQLLLHNKSIKHYDGLIESALATHQMVPIIENLPCGKTAKARIIAALGDDRQRYSNASQLTAAVGIAPLTIQSGKNKSVKCRWATSKFRRQTFHEFAVIAMKRCTWSKAFYESQIAKGKKPAMAARALAYKWIRIIFRCWQQNEPYCEQKYLQCLAKRDSPLAARIQAATH